MGYEVCRALETRAKVIAVVGPCEAPFHKLKATKLVRVETVDDMHKAVMRICAQQNPDFAVLSAAVLDFAPKSIQPGKVSSKGLWKVTLGPTPKIIDQITKRFPKVRKVAFKLEWKAMGIKSLKRFAVKNMRDKSAELLCLNFLSDIKGKKHPAFLVTPNGKFKKVRNKKEIAAYISRYILASE